MTLDLPVSYDARPSVDLYTVVKLPDLAKWELSARTSSWINILWMEEVRMMHNSNIDQDNSPYALVRARSIPDSNLRDLQNGCSWISKKILSEEIKRPVVHFNCDSKIRSATLGDPNIEASYWINDDLYSGNLEPVQRNEVQKWLGSTETIYVYECDSAGRFLKDCDSGNFYLAACSEGESLPNRDLFSKLLSVPVQTSYEWHCDRMHDTTIKRRPITGDLNDRQTLLGQLDWVLTLITDAIAKDSLNKDEYFRLFCEDLLTGTLFRRFLIAQRILKSHGCKAISNPALPDCSHHRLWAIWDYLMEMTAMLIAVQSEKECPIITTFFSMVMKDYYQDHPTLLLPALTQSKFCKQALEGLNVCWDKLKDDLDVQKLIINETVRLVCSQNYETRSSAIEYLTGTIVNHPGVENWMSFHEDMNLCAYLNSKTSPKLISQTLFLQLLLEKHSPRCNPNHKHAVGAICCALMEHSDPKVRIWSALLAATLTDGAFPGFSDRLQDLLSDAVPEVRASALESWIASFNGDANQSDICIAKLLAMLKADSNLLVRREVTESLISMIVPNRIFNLIAVCKQESISAKQLDQLKSKNKIKFKHPPKTKSDLELGRTWRALLALQHDPDPIVSSSIRSVVAYVMERLTELPSNGKKKKKKADGVEAAIPLPVRESMHHRFRQDLLVGEAENPTEVTIEECGPSIMNGSSERRKLTLALLDHQWKSFPVRKVPEMVHLGPDRQIVTVCGGDVTWQDYVTEATAHVSAPARVTSVLLDYVGLRPSLLLGCHDGTVQLWQSDRLSSPTMTTTWQALYDFDGPAASKKTHGLLMTRCGARQLIVGGDAKYLRRWDLEKELTMGDVFIGTDQTVASITSNGRFNVAAGLQNGTVRLFDLRAEAGGKISVGPKHGHPVRAVSLRPDDLTLVSVCRGGTVHQVDLRKMIPARKKWSLVAAPADVAIHGRLDMMATTGDGWLEMDSLGGDRICGTPEEVQPDAVSVGFHPIEAMLAAGCRRDGGAVVLYGEN